MLVFKARVTTWFTESQSDKGIYPIKTDSYSISPPQILPRSTFHDALHTSDSYVSLRVCSLSLAYNTINTVESSSLFSWLPFR